MRRKLWIFGLVVTLAILSGLVLLANGMAVYDLQSMGLIFVRINAWIIALSFYRMVAAALGDDDLEADWGRINEGNVAVALYRAVEFAVIGAALAMLVYKV